MNNAVRIFSPERCAIQRPSLYILFFYLQRICDIFAVNSITNINHILATRITIFESGLRPGLCLIHHFHALKKFIFFVPLLSASVFTCVYVRVRGLTTSTTQSHDKFRNTWCLVYLLCFFIIFSHSGEMASERPQHVGLQ